VPSGTDVVGAETSVALEPISVVDIANYTVPKQLLSLFYNEQSVSSLIFSAKIWPIGGF
jgi:hypothetical protein